MDASKTRMSEPTMRAIHAALTVAVTLLGVASAQAEKKTFIITSDAGSYGVDRCLTTGAHCGVAAATAYCKSRDFAQAASFRKLERDEITGSVPAGNAACGSPNCQEFVAIECTR
jgi:hypothetical protein